jgi:hypothetical protein
VALAREFHGSSVGLRVVVYLEGGRSSLDSACSVVVSATGLCVENK